MAQHAGAQRSSKWEMVKDENGKWVSAEKLARKKAKEAEQLKQQQGDSATAAVDQAEEDDGTSRSSSAAASASSYEDMRSGALGES